MVIWEGGREPRRSKQRGSGSATFIRRPPTKLVGSPAASLSQPGMPGGVLDLFALRSRAVLLQSELPQRSSVPAMPCCQPPPPAESGGPARSSGPETCVYRQRHAPGRVTDQSSHSVISPAPFGCGETVPLPSKPPCRLEKRPDPWLRCSICGRPGRFPDPFPQIPRRR